MTLFESVKTCYDKYATFSGHASRSEFWWANTFYVAVFLLLRYGIRIFLLSTSACMVAHFWTVICFLPLISVAVRRLHDTGRSGLWLLGFLVCYAVIMIVVIDVVMLWNELTFIESIEQSRFLSISISIIAVAYYIYVMSQPAFPQDFNEF